MTFAPASRVHRTSAMTVDAQGQGAAREVRKAAPFARSKSSGIDDALSRASQSSLLASLKKIGLPDHFSPRQQQAVARLLDKYHPHTLTQSPLVGINGKALNLQLASVPLTDPQGTTLPSGTPLNRGLIRMLTHFPEHRRWEDSNLGVRTIRPGEAEAALVGQEGVFAKRNIPANTPVSIFGGMFLDRPEDIALDAQVRSMAGLQPNKYQDSDVSANGNVMNAMGIAMKCNSNEHAHNLMPAYLHVIAPSGEKLQLMALYSTKPIKAGEELSMSYHEQLRLDNQL
ncbi:SET domain-containing protein [Variovorax sp. RHLX14]|uniref:SET domain-containing protein n=1 Tax=Variovorax sp. RHLX14 TaxID=1259731 RepID=UPI003F481654